MNPETIDLAFVGALPQPEDRVGNPAFSQAGVHFMENLLRHIGKGGVDVSHVFSTRPVASWPAGPRLWFGYRRTSILGGIPCTLLPFVNLGPLKTLSSGVALFPLLLRWAWERRGRKGKALLLYNVSSPPGIVSVVAGRLTGTKVIAIVADVQVPGEGLVPDTWLRRVDHALQAWTLGLLDGVVAVNRNIVRDFCRRMPSIVIEGAVPEGLAGAADADGGDGPSVDGSPFVFMYAGGLSELKGIPLLLEAFSRLEGEGYRLWITGKGPAVRLVEDAAKADPRIRYFGFLPYEEVVRRYAQASALVNPHSATLRSGQYLFPSKLIEFLATGKPVVSTCSVPEVLEEYGDVLLPVRSDTPDALAGQLRRVAAMPEPERRAIGESGRRLVLEHKGWEGQSRKVAALVRRAVEGD